MASSPPPAIREFLDDAKVSSSDRTAFLDSLREFLTNDASALETPSDPAQLVVWGQVLNQVASYLFASSRALSPKSSPKKPYPLTLSEVELWMEIQNARSKSQIGADGSGLPAMPSTELFVVDDIRDAEARPK
jgi:hypothetical protein